MMRRLWVLGAADPEMAAIAAILSDAGETAVWATWHGAPVAPSKAYECDPVPAGTHWVECAPAGGRLPGAVVIDHHRAGDPGFGLDPSSYLEASSLGQVAAVLAAVGVSPNGWEDVGLPGSKYLPAPRVGWTESTSFNSCKLLGIASGETATVSLGETLSPDERGSRESFACVTVVRTRLLPPESFRLTAAGDHCPGAAYAGRCPGVDPERLMAHRATATAAYRKMTVEAVIAEVVAAMAMIRAAQRIFLGGAEVADLRPGTVPGLPEASLRLGVCVIYEMVERDGRRKVGLLGAGEGTPAGPAPAAEFISVWGPAQGLTGLYGDPVRGFAGGYR
jgi:hypothetical protein